MRSNNYSGCLCCCALEFNSSHNRTTTNDVNKGSHSSLQVFIQGPAEIPDDFANSYEWNRWRGEFVLECPSSETQSISVVIERWFAQHRPLAVETHFKNNDSVVTQRIFRRHFNIHRNECP